MENKETSTFTLMLPESDIVLTKEQETAVSEFLDLAIEEFKSNSVEMNRLILECSVCASRADSLSSSLARQNMLSRAWNNLTGKNAGIRATISKELASGQYASQLLITKLAEQNALTMDVVLKLNEEKNELILKVQNDIATANTFIKELFLLLQQYMAYNSSELENTKKLIPCECMTCHRYYPSQKLLCPHCFAVNKSDSFLSLSAAAQASIKKSSKEMIDLMNKTKSKAPITLWDPSVTEYFNHITTLQEFFYAEPVKQLVSASSGGYSNLYKKMQIFKNACYDSCFQVAIVGSVKAGKSTLINALLGDNLASTSVTPETSVLSKFRASKMSDYIKITFYNQREWDRLTSEKNLKKGFVAEMSKSIEDASGYERLYVMHKPMTLNFKTRDELKEALIKWTDSDSPEHFFVKEVEIGIKDSFLPDSVILVDTPGLNDPVQYRSDITRKYIKHAHAVILCLKSDNLENSDIKLIAQVIANFNNGSDNIGNIFIAATQIDRFNKPLEDWPEQKSHFIEQLSPLYGEQGAGLLSQRLFGVSAYTQTYVNKYRSMPAGVAMNEFLKDNQFLSLVLRYDISIMSIPENIDNLESYAGIKFFLNQLSGHLFSNYKETILSTIAAHYNSVLSDVEATLLRIFEYQRTVAEAKGADSDSIKGKIAALEKSIATMKSDQAHFDGIMASAGEKLSAISQALTQHFSEVKK